MSLKKRLREVFRIEVLESAPRHKMKVLILDQRTLRIVSSLFLSSEIFEFGFVDIYTQVPPRQPSPFYVAVYFITPGERSMRLILNDFNLSPPKPLPPAPSNGKKKKKKVKKAPAKVHYPTIYQSCYLFFSNKLSQKCMKLLTDSSVVKKGFIRAMKEININYTLVDENGFSLNMPNDMYDLYHPSSTQRNQAYEYVVKTLKQFLLTNELIPIIRYQFGSKISEYVAKQLYHIFSQLLEQKKEVIVNMKKKIETTKNEKTEELEVEVEGEEEEEGELEISESSSSDEDPYGGNDDFDRIFEDIDSINKKDRKKAAKEKKRNNANSSTEQSMKYEVKKVKKQVYTRIAKKLQKYEKVLFFVCERNIDLIVPFLHDFDFYPMISDIFKLSREHSILLPKNFDEKHLTGNSKIIERFSKAPKTRKLHVLGSGYYFNQLKWMHFQKVQKFMAEEINRIHSDRENILDVKDSQILLRRRLVDMFAKIPNLKRKQYSYCVLRSIVVEIQRKLKEENLMGVSLLEQDIACRYTDEGKFIGDKIIENNFKKLLGIGKTYPLETRLRLVILFILSISDPNKRNQYIRSFPKMCGITALSDFKILQNLQYLKIKYVPQPIYRKTPFDVSRYIPKIRLFLGMLIKKGKSLNIEFPFISFKDQGKYEENPLFRKKDIRMEKISNPKTKKMLQGVGSWIKKKSGSVKNGIKKNIIDNVKRKKESPEHSLNFRKLPEEIRKKQMIDKEYLEKQKLEEIESLKRIKMQKSNPSWVFDDDDEGGGEYNAKNIEKEKKVLEEFKEKGKSSSKKVIVFVLGGITLPEIRTSMEIEKDTSVNCIIGSTDLITYERIKMKLSKM